YGRTKWEGFVKTSGEVTMGFTKGLLTGIIEGIVDTAGLAYQLVVDPQQVGQDMLYAAEYLIQNPDMVVEAAKQMYANFESASPEEKAEMVGKVSSILVPGMGVTKAGKAAKVPEALSSMTQTLKTSKAMNVLANPVKKLKDIDWKSYTNRFRDWAQSLKPGRFAVTPEGMLIRMPDESSSVVRRIDAGDSKKIEGTGQGLKVPQGLTQAQFDKVSSMIREKVGHISDDIVVQGSRAKGTAKPTSDIDIAIRVPAEKFDELIQSSFSKVKPPNPGSAKEKTMLHAIETGKIQSGEAKLSKFREQLQQELGMDVDISIIKMGGPFDNPPFTPLK
ncbi:nucleotidyltransferase domain-containing protein, partial [Paenibacillus aquistagni]|uniref:nucleotidyltransferase domain-containing protein n=1 Tax=Paenibacillus aquistagni TaxID=1852522 RepID=UPI0011326AFB